MDRPDGVRMTGPKTVSEKILSAKSGREARAGDVVICNVDLVLGTDASSPMAIDYFERMDGQRLFDPARVLFSFDHYSPPTSERTRAFHDRVRAFVARFGGTILEVGEGISFQVVVERGLALPGDLVVGADSHTVTCGALNLFATGVGSSDLAAAMFTGQVWLRVPETILVRIIGQRPPGLAAKDAALALVAEVGAEGANYQAIEFVGPALGQLSLEDRLVFSNLAVEMGAKAAIFPFDETAHDYLAGRENRRGTPVGADEGAVYSREVALDLSALSPRVALPHAPNNVVPIADAAGTPIQMVFIGTCTGGRVTDLHEALAVLRRGGSRLAPGVHLVVTPASREVERRLTDDGTLAELVGMGATITMPGCGACCGTSGVIPTRGTSVLSTANRNFKARMGPASVSIFLASPAACAAAALSGRITDPGVARG
jgi:3-isopropylmalate/(R)-2-methylmalate dehydratase large subunit